MKTGRAWVRVVVPLMAALLAAACVSMPSAGNVTTVTGPGSSSLPAAADDQTWLPKAEALGAHLTPWSPQVLSTPTPVTVPTTTPEVTPTPAPTETATPDASSEVSASVPTAVAPPQAVVGTDVSTTVGEAVALTRVPDADPAPPLTIAVESVRLVNDGATYRITGSIRNDGTQTYEDIGIEATFYTTDVWHYGPFDAKLGSYTLAPGESCAFLVEAYARDYTGYRLHPTGYPLKAWTGGSTPLTVADAHVVDQDAGYVHLAGVVRNDTESTIGDVRVSGQLLDEGGVVTSMETTVLAGPLAPGGQIGFDLNVPAAAYATFGVTAEGELR